MLLNIFLHFYLLLQPVDHGSLYEAFLWPPLTGSLTVFAMATVVMRGR